MLISFPFHSLINQFFQILINFTSTYFVMFTLGLQQINIGTEAKGMSKDLIDFNYIIFNINTKLQRRIFIYVSFFFFKIKKEENSQIFECLVGSLDSVSFGFSQLVSYLNKHHLDFLPLLNSHTYSLQIESITLT